MDAKASLGRWIGPLAPDGGPLYQQIVTAIEAGLASGTLRPGDKLPPQRLLAQELNVDLTTVTRAYSEARHRQLLEAVTGRGSFIPMRPASLGLAIDLSMNIPPSPRGVNLADMIAKGVGELTRRSNIDQIMSYHPGVGSPGDRAAGAVWLGPTMGPMEPERIVISPGAQTAIAAIVSAHTRPGDVVLSDPLTYPGFLRVAAQFGLQVAAVEGDGLGMRPDALQAAVARHGARLVYLMPSLHNPTTLTMPATRRQDIAKTAEALNCTIIEDDPYALLAEDAPPPIFLSAPGSTYHIATLSKCLTPGLRAAFVVAPSRDAQEKLIGGLRAMTLMTAPLMTALLTLWIRSGAAQDLLDGVKAEVRERQTLARAILPATAQADPNGLHVWQPLPAHWDRHRLIDTALRQGLGVTASDAFHVSGPAPDAVRISLGAVADRAQLATSLKTLAVIIGDTRRALHDVV